MERNITLDYFKVILSILVITIHLGVRLTETHPLWNWFISQGIARIAVPCFFIINGYYLVKKINDFGATKKYILHLLTIYITWFVFYTLFYDKKIDQVNFLQNFLLGSSSHLWYVVGLMHGCILFFILKKGIRNDHILLVLAILLFLGGIIWEGMGRDACNGLFIGFPFVFCGYYIDSKDLVSKIKDIYLIPLILLCLTMLLTESYLAFRAYVAHNLYIALIVLCPLVIIFIFKHSTYKLSNNHLMNFGSIASAIYFIHPFVILMLRSAGFPNAIIRFAAVCVLSFISSIFIVYINRYVKIFL